MKLIAWLISALAWLQIFIAAAIIGAIAGIPIWLMLRGFWGVTLGTAVAALGCIIGIVLAEKARRGKGTLEFISRITAPSELREKE